LAVIAGIMAYRGDPEGFEKLFWTVILFSFLFTEIRAIDNREWHDKQEHEVEMRKEERHFREIGAGITAGVDGILQQSHKQFDDTISQMSKQFFTTIDSMTGGKSYAIVFPNTDGDENATSLPLFTKSCTNCPYTIPDAQVEIKAQNGVVSLLYEGNIDPAFARRLPSIAVDANVETEYVITVYARNRPTTETLKIRFNSKTHKWQFSFRVTRSLKDPHRNPVTQQAEGALLKVLETQDWTGFGSTPLSPDKTTLIQQK
jgi:hypothetical protein